MPQLIVAMDLPALEKAKIMAERLSGIAQWLKIGLELFTIGGPQFVSQLKDKDFKIFLDLKYYDIPNTVGRAVKAASVLGVDMLTLHCQGGKKMCEAALEALAGASTPPLLFGVTVLTSFVGSDMPGIHCSLPEYAQQLAADALDWGLNGVVCSGREVKSIKKDFPSLLALCPGIRPTGYLANDQSRVVTPGCAVAAGADYLVVGRPILESNDPAKIVSEIICEMENA